MCIRDRIILNYANCDMVGHTGVFEAAVKAVEAVDTCVGRVVAVSYTHLDVYKRQAFLKTQKRKNNCC